MRRNYQCQFLFPRTKKHQTSVIKTLPYLSKQIWKKGSSFLTRIVPVKQLSCFLCRRLRKGCPSHRSSTKCSCSGWDSCISSTASTITSWRGWAWAACKTCLWKKRIHRCLYLISCYLLFQTVLILNIMASSWFLCYARPGTMRTLGSIISLLYKTHSS